ncbi:hypothetical protein [Campylobacter helveticus]|uniref:hypothetical protein n=1 Tax=Campylobacter helveticus TaxID=28898 RepID=UPI002149C227|nr:hypothetical protein [Campylobacter helveticus]MCR2062406.1 hypothetical protein [Campylobacter helveticus]MCR2067168.1 hypothetical protein [Campylobacter helveticus]
MLLSMEFGRIIAQRAFGFRIWVSLSTKTFSISLALGLKYSGILPFYLLKHCVISAV